MQRSKEVQFNVALCILFLFFLGGCTTYYIKSKNISTEALPSVREAKAASIATDGHFAEALKVVLKHEGYLSNVKGDAGGLTKYGLSYRYLSALVKQDPKLAAEIDINHNHVLDTYDVYNLSVAEASSIYKKEFWDKYQFNQVKYAPLAIKLFDLSVNMGHGEVIKLLSRTYKKVFKLSNVNYDTINMLTPSQNEVLLQQLCAESKSYYQEIALDHPVYQKFLKGWLNRVAEGC